MDLLPNYAGDNNLVGTIPTELGRLTEMTNLRLCKKRCLTLVLLEEIVSWLLAGFVVVFWVHNHVAMSTSMDCVPCSFLLFLLFFLLLLVVIHYRRPQQPGRHDSDGARKINSSGMDRPV